MHIHSNTFPLAKNLKRDVFAYTFVKNYWHPERISSMKTIIDTLGLFCGMFCCKWMFQQDNDTKWIKRKKCVNALTKDLHIDFSISGLWNAFPHSTFKNPVFVLFILFVHFLLIFMGCPNNFGADYMSLDVQYVSKYIGRKLHFPKLSTVFTPHTVLMMIFRNIINENFWFVLQGSLNWEGTTCLHWPAMNSRLFTASWRANIGFKLTLKCEEDEGYEVVRIVWTWSRWWWWWWWLTKMPYCLHSHCECVSLSC